MSGDQIGPPDAIAAVDGDIPDDGTGFPFTRWTRAQALTSDPPLLRFATLPEAP
jgi:hypothetical protein